MSCEPKIVGILNVTDDSFYDGGIYTSLDKAVKQAIKMQEDGASIIEIGGESTRPFSEPVSLKQELSRVLPVIEALAGKITIPLAIDTLKPEVAKEACQRGVTLINDVAGFRDPKMVAVAADFSTKICLMHMLGSPKTMQVDPHYPRGVTVEVSEWLFQKAEKLIQSGVRPENIILDPGIGFGKTVADNYKIIQNLHLIKEKGFPILLGISRKSFMGKTVNKPPQELLVPTIALNTAAVLAGVEYLRVHDVAEHKCALVCLEKLDSSR